VDAATGGVAPSARVNSETKVGRNTLCISAPSGGLESDDIGDQVGGFAPIHEPRFSPGASRL